MGRFVIAASNFHPKYHPHVLICFNVSLFPAMVRAVYFVFFLVVATDFGKILNIFKYVVI